MRAARLARASSGHAPPFGGSRSLLARCARLQRAQEPAHRAGRRPARARRGGRGRPRGHTRHGRARWRRRLRRCQGVRAARPGRAAGGSGRSVRRRAAAGVRRGVGLRGPRGASPPLRRSAGAPGLRRRGGRRAEGRHSHLASRRRARSAARGRPPRAHPAPDRGGGGRRRAPGLRRPRTPPADRAARAALERDPSPPRGHSRARGRPHVGGDRDAAAASPGLGAARAQPVRRPRGLARLASGPMVRCTRRVGPAGGDRRRSRHREDAACERARPRRSRGGWGGAPRPLSRGAADVLSAVRRGVRAVRRRGVARGAARPGRPARRRVGAARSRARPQAPGPCRAGPRRCGGRAVPAVRGRRRAARERVAIVAGRAGARGPALGG